jgi:hypothetical protein
MTDPKFQHTPGQLARWEADRLKREALVKPAPIGFDPSKAEIKWPRLTHGGQTTHAERKAERLIAEAYALVKSLGGFMYPRDCPADWPTKEAVAVTSRLNGRMYVPWAPVLNTDALLVNSDSPRYAGVAGKPAEPPHQQPLDLSGVTLDAEGWSSEIPVPDNLKPWHDYLCRSDEVRYRITGGELVAIRIKARSASDTEGLPIGAVVRVWYDGMPSPEVPRYAMFGGGTLPWSRLMSTAEQAAGDRERITMSAFPCTVYLPIDVRGA